MFLLCLYFAKWGLGRRTRELGDNEGFSRAPGLMRLNLNLEKEDRWLFILVLVV